MEVEVVSVVEKTIGEDVVTIVVEPDRATSRVKGDRQEVTVQDSWDLSPSKTRLTVDYDIPASLTTGLFVDVEELQGYVGILQGEVGAISTTYYNKTESDAQLTSLDTKFLQNDNWDAKVASVDFTNLYISPGGATFQELQLDVVQVADNTASLTQDVQIQATNYGSAVSRIETIEASSGEYSAQITDLAVVAAGQFIFWDGTTPDPNHIGNVIYTTTSSAPAWGSNTTTDPEIGTIAWQFLGTDLEPSNGGWRQLTSITGTFGAAKSIYTDGDRVVGWAYSGGSGSPSEFVVKTDSFKIYNSETLSDVALFDVNTTTNLIKMTANVEIDGSLVVDGSITTDHMTANTIDGDRISAGTLVSDRLTSKGTADSFDISALADAGPDSDANIYGGIIKGGTLIAGNTVFYNDASKLTDYLAVSKDTTTVNGGLYNMSWEIYSYNSTNISYNRAKSASGDILEFTGQNTVIISDIMYKTILIIGGEFSASLSKIRFGTSTWTDIPVGISTYKGIRMYTNLYQVPSTTFYVYTIYIADMNVLSSVSGNEKLEIQVSITGSVQDFTPSSMARIYNN